MKRIIVLIFILLIYSYSYAINLEISKKVSFKENIKYFCVTEDDLIICSNSNGNLSIFEQNKNSYKAVKNISTGLSNGNISYCYYDTKSKILGVYYKSYGSILLFKRIDRLTFEIFDSIRNIDSFYNMKITGNKVFISGNINDSYDNSYELYSINLFTKEIEYLIPTYKKYRIDKNDSIDEYSLKYIEMDGFFDINGSDVYYLWKCDLWILKYNTDSGSLNVFGVKHNNYVKPYISISENKSVMSFIKDVFIVNDRILVIIDGQTKKSKLWMQEYDFDGNLIYEKDISLKSNSLLYYNKYSNMLYSFENNFIITYKIGD